MNAPPSRTPAATSPAVLLAARPAAGGMRAHLVTLAGGLQRAGWRVVWAAPAAWPSTRPLAPSDLLAAARLAAAVRRIRPSVVHAHGWKGGLVAALARAVGWAPRRPGTPASGSAARPAWVWTIHGPPAAGLPRPARPVVRALARWVARRFDAIIAVSEGLVREWQPWLGDVPVRVVPNAVLPTDLARSPEAAQEVGGEASGPDAAAPGPGVPDAAGSVVLFAGRLIPQKGPDRFLRMAVAVARRQPAARFWLAGDGPERGALEALARRLGLGDRVRFLGQRPDMPALYLRAAVVVVPSRGEGFSLVALEAMAAGRPVVATAAGGLPEVVGDAGVLVAPGDDAGLAAAAADLLADPARRRELGERGRRRAAEFSLLRMVDATLAVYAAAGAAARGTRTAAARGGRAAPGRAGDPAHPGYPPQVGPAGRVGAPGAGRRVPWWARALVAGLLLTAAAGLARRSGIPAPDGPPPHGQGGAPPQAGAPVPAPPGSPVPPAGAAGAARRVILVLLDRLPAATLLAVDGEPWATLRERGAVGLLNTATAANHDPGAAYATVSAGLRAGRSEAAGLAFDAGEEVRGAPAAALYRRWTGRDPADAAVLHAGIAAVRLEQAGVAPRPQPGTLGQRLGEAGVRRIAIGNRDRPGELDRPAALIAADFAGRVDGGRVGAAVARPDPEAPAGVRTDVNAVLRAYDAWVRREAAGPVFAVVDLGDGVRLDLERSRIAPEALARHQAAVLEDAGRVIADLLGDLDWGRDLLVITALLPPEEEARTGRALTPVLAAGRGITPGWLTSPSTRRLGLVTSADLTATVLDAFGVPLEGVGPLAGRVIRAVAAPEARARPALAGRPGAGGRVEPLLRLAGVVGTVQAARPAFIRSYVLLHLLALAPALAAIAFPGPGARWAAAPFLMLAALPLAAMLLALAPPADPPVLLGGVWGLAIALAGLAAWLTRRAGTARWPLAFGGLGLATAATVCLDALTGGQVAPQSLFGYSLVVGARFYGIGNEAMGVLVGAGLVGLGALVDAGGRGGRRRWAALSRAAALGLGAAAVLVLAWPGAGVNFGGAAAATVGLMTFALRLRGRPAGWRAVALTGVATALAVGAAVALDLATPAAWRSHVGLAAAQAGEGGLGTLAGIALRKLELNLKLFRWTSWTWVFLALLGTSALLCRRPPGVLGRALRAHPGLGHGIVAAVAGACVALVANDSGIVAAATAMSLPGGLVLVLTIEARCAGGGGGSPGPTGPAEGGHPGSGDPG